MISHGSVLIFKLEKSSNQPQIRNLFHVIESTNRDIIEVLTSIVKTPTRRYNQLFYVYYKLTIISVWNGKRKQQTHKLLLFFFGRILSKYHF